MVIEVLTADAVAVVLVNVVIPAEDAGTGMPAGDLEASRCHCRPAVHVLSRWPLRPWTATVLMEETSQQPDQGRKQGAPRGR